LFKKHQKGAQSKSDLIEIIFETNEVIFETNKPLDTAYFITQGTVELELTLGNKSISLLVGENQFIGDVAVAVESISSAAENNYHVKATANERVTAVEISILEIKHELDNCSPILKVWFASFISRVLVVIDKLTQ